MAVAAVTLEPVFPLYLHVLLKGFSRFIDPIKSEIELQMIDKRSVGERERKIEI